jgi:endo-1,4-beta-xylanase
LLSPAPPSREFAGEASLRQHAARHNLLYGCAVNVPRLTSDPAYAALVIAQSSILVAEGAMKWAALRPTPTTFDFDQADALIAFAEQNRIKLRGHNLLWHRALPAWFSGYANAANADQLLLNHIDQVAGRYAGRMHSWDVVNEAVDVKDGRPDGLRVTPWLQLLGAGYIETAFRAARRADPQALLTYNDYGIEGEDPASQRKRDAVLLLLERLKTRNVPIDAVGVQSHISADPRHMYGAGLMRFLAEVRQLGLEVFLTELDVNDRDLPADVTTRDQAVAATYQRYLDLVLAEPAVRAVLTWGITDRYTWLNGENARADHLPERCLPFDSAYTPTSAFFAIRNSFDHRPPVRTKL